MNAAFPPPQAGRAFPIFIVLVALAAMAGGVWLSTALDRSAQPPVLQSGTLLTPAKSIPAFTLQDQNGRSLGLDRLRGHWTMLFFGYTHCPDVCPNTLAVLNLAMKQLELPLRERTQVLLVSVDPQRDTPAQLARYVAYFNPDFIAASGPTGQLDTLTRSLGVLYVHNKPDPQGNYTVDHSAQVLLIDPQGELAAIFSNLPHDPEKMARDLRHIHNFYEARS